MLLAIKWLVRCSSFFGSSCPVLLTSQIGVRPIVEFFVSLSCFRCQAYVVLRLRPLFLVKDCWSDSWPVCCPPLSSSYLRLSFIFVFWAFRSASFTGFHGWSLLSPLLLFSISPRAISLFLSAERTPFLSTSAPLAHFQAILCFSIAFVHCSSTISYFYILNRYKDINLWEPPNSTFELSLLIFPWGSFDSLRSIFPRTEQQSMTSALSVSDLKCSPMPASFLTLSIPPLFR